MLARHLGAKVCFHPDGMAEVGYYPIRPTAFGRAVVPVWPDHVYQWHREGFDLPAGAELLAEGDTFRCRRSAIGAAYAIQFHAEVTHAMMCRWTTRGHERMLLPGAKPRAAHFADRPVYDPAIRAWLAEFLDRWIESRPRPRRPAQWRQRSPPRRHRPDDVARSSRPRARLTRAPSCAGICPTTPPTLLAPTAKAIGGV